MRNALVLLGVGAAVAAAPDVARGSVPDWSEPVEVANGLASSVGIDGRGAVTAAWQTAEVGAWRSFVATGAPGARSFGEAVRLGAGVSIAPTVAVAESGEALVLWREPPDPSCVGSIFLRCPTRLLVRARPAAGGEFGPAVLLAEDSEAGILAMNDRGEAVVAWTTVDGSLRAVLRDRRGGLTPVQTLAGPVNTRAPRLSAAVGDSGAAVVSRAMLTSTPAPVTAWYRAAGGPFGAAEDASGGAQGFSTAAAVDERGTASVLSSTDRGIQLATRTARGEFGTPRPLAPDGTALGFSEDARGDQVAYWIREVSERSDPRPRVQAYASFRDLGEDWRVPSAILREDAWPALELDGVGNAHAVWTEGPDVGQRLFGATLTRFGILERPQRLSSTTAQFVDMDVNRAGAAAGFFTEYTNPHAPSGGAVARIVTRVADEAAARMSLAARLRDASVDLAIRCDEACRVRAAVGPGRDGAAATAGRRRTVTLRAGRRGRLRLRLTPRQRAALARGERLRLTVRAVDAAGNVRRVRRFVSA